MHALAHILFSAISLYDWQAAAIDAAMRTAGFDRIELEARPSAVRWSVLLPDVSASWSNQDLLRTPIEESSGSAYASRGQTWQLRASWDLSRFVPIDNALPWGHMQLQLSERRHALRRELAGTLARACEGGLEGVAARAQLAALTAGWSARYPPPGACAGQQVPK